MTYVINRSFDRRGGANIGKVELVAPGGEYTLDGKALPEASVTALLRFSLQLLQDAYAGAKSDDEATGMFLGKYDRLVAGALGIRGDGSGADARTLVARSVVRNAFMMNNPKGSEKRDEFLADSPENQLARLDTAYAKNAAHFDPMIEAEIALRAERAAIKVKAAEIVAFEM